MSVIATVEWELLLRNDPLHPERYAEWMEFYDHWIRPALPENWRVLQIKILNEGCQLLNVRARSLGDDYQRIKFRAVSLPEGVRFPIHLLDPKVIS